MHSDQPSMDLSEYELDVPLKSVSEPNMKTYESLPLSPAIRRHSRHFATISFSGTPAPTSPLEASKRRTQRAQTVKCLRFDFSPSFFDGNVPDEACVREIQNENSASLGNGMPEGKENSPFFGEKMPNDKNGAVTQEFTSQKIDVHFAPIACELPISVKNTFVHLDRSLSEDDDDDEAGDRPKRCVSAPAMPALNDKSIGVMCATKSDPLPCNTPCSSIEYNAALPQETSDRGQYDDGEDHGTHAEDAPVFPALLAGRVHSVAQHPQDMSCGSCSSTTSALSLRQNSFFSMIDGSCSASFRVKNTFVHMDVNKDAEEDRLDLPMRRVSEPAFKLEQDANQVQLPPHSSATSTLPSVGAALHSSGQCKPCAWFWKPESCQWGAECQHCHLCPLGELRRRKKGRQAEAKELKREAAAFVLADGVNKQAAILAENDEGFH